MVKDIAFQGDGPLPDGTPVPSQAETPLGIRRIKAALRRESGCECEVW